jgi:hypothetical protein
VVSVPAENHNVYIYIYPMNLSCQHVMKAFPFITTHYRKSICTITAVQTTLAYVIETTYSRGYRKMRGYEQRSPYPAPNHNTPNVVNLSWYISSISSRPLLEKQRSARITDEKAKLPQLAEDPYLLTSRSKVSLQKVKLGCA